MKSLVVNLRTNVPLKAILTAMLILTFAVPMASLPAADAHSPAWNIPTFAYVVALPNPIGVHQSTIIYLFLGNPPYPDAAIANDYRYHNYKLTTMKPNGQNETKSWATIVDTTNSQMYLFTPDQVGTYTFIFDFPGQNVSDYSHLANSAYLNDYFMPSSYTTTLTVQADPVATVADPLPPAFPTEYWTRPIYGENTAWWNISSNWLGSGILGYGGMCGPNEQMFPGDAVGPLTGHIMWAKPLQSGGIVGGDNYEIQGNQYFEGSAYNQRFLNPIIVHQRLYYTEPLSFYSEGSMGSAVYGPVDCVDLRTGQLIWSRTDVPPLSFALIWDNEDPQQHGVTPALLFTSNFARAFDADTGNALFNVTGVPSGSSVLGPRGEVLKYYMANAGNTTNPDWRLAEWNSTKLWSGMGFPGNLTTTLIPTLQNSSNGATLSLPGGKSTNSFIVDASITTGNYNRNNWNVSISWRNSMPASGGNAPSIIGVFPGNLLLCRNGSYPALGAYYAYTYFAINLDNKTRPGYKVGDVLWWSTIDPPAGKNITTVTYAGASIEAGVFVESYRQTSQFVGYSLTDGKYLWGPTASQCPLDYYGSQGPGTLADQIAYGRIYSVAYSGILYCYNMKDGELLWTYGNGGAGNSTNGNLIVPGPYPTFLNAIGQGIVYLVTSEHTIETPIFPGALMRAVNATDGKEIWTLSNVNNEFNGESFAIADGYLTTFNGYDNRIYSVGRGPSQTTVTAAPKIFDFGSYVMIEGTVTDISAGTLQDEQAARFPNGVPAVSDASMSDWMGYVYQQKSKPKDTVGVEVILAVFDSNNNTYYIGSTTTDSSGAFSFMWQPQIPGKFTIYATFGGTNGYWPSTAETAIGVVVPPSPSVVPTATPATPAVTVTPPPTGAPTASPSPSLPPENPTGGSNTALYVGIAAVVIIAAVAMVALFLRKRK